MAKAKPKKLRGNYKKNAELIVQFGNRVKELREGIGMSQREFANNCDLDHSQISRIELGKVSTSLSMVFLLAKNLGITPQELITFENKD